MTAGSAIWNSTPQSPSSSTTAGEYLAFAACEHDRLGEVERLALGAVGALLATRHRLRERIERARDLVRNRPAVGDRERGLDHVSVGKRRSGAVAWA